jgi:Putative auto-transporter adhesin, head GIN domain
MRAFLIASPFLALAVWGVATNATDRLASSEKRSFAVRAFDAVSLEGSDNVRVVRGPLAPVTATGKASALDKLAIRVEGNTLKIGRKPGRGWSMGWNSDGDVTVTVTVPDVRAVAVAGSGNMTVDRVDRDVFSASVAGSGDLKIAALRARSVVLGVTGSGKLDAAGSVQNAQMNVRGSGDVDAMGLASARATISVAGSGNLGTTVTESATIAVSGSGDVAVRGTDRCAITKSGSGEVTCAR